MLYDFFVEGMTPRGIRRDGNRGAGGSGLLNGAGGSSLANSRRLEPALFTIGFLRASWTREGGTCLVATTLFVSFLSSSSSSVMDDTEYFTDITCRCGCRGDSCSSK